MVAGGTQAVVAGGSQAVVAGGTPAVVAGGSQPHRKSTKAENGLYSCVQSKESFLSAWSR